MAQKEQKSKRLRGRAGGRRTISGAARLPVLPEDKKAEEAKSHWPTNQFPLTEGTHDINSPAFIENLKRDKYKTPDILKKGGTDVKFRSEFQRQVYWLIRMGYNNEKIGQFFGVHEDTVNRWMKEHEGFQEAAVLAKFSFGFDVVNTITQRAMGYDYDEVEEGTALNKQGEVIHLRKVIHKHMPPDVASLIFILKNRYPDEWSDVARNNMDNAAKTALEVAKKLDMSLFDEQEQALLKRIAIKKASQLRGQAESE